MGHLLPLLVLMVAMAIVATADPSSWVAIQNVDKDPHAQSLGIFAVNRYNEQNHAYLKFLQVVRGEELDRGSQHYTYRLVIKVLDSTQTRLYRTEVLQDLSSPSQPPALNLGSFAPLSHPPRPPAWTVIPNAANDWQVQSLGAFAVKRHNTQNHAAYKFLLVTDGQVLGRGTKHYTYHLTIMVLDRYVITYFKIEVFQDLSAPDESPVLNLGYFLSL